MDAFRTAWVDGQLGGALSNSVIVTVCTVIAVLFLASLAAFALSRYRIPAGRAILLLMLAGNLLPPQILLIPVAKICELIGIYDTLFALIVVQVGFGMGFFTFVLHGFMRSTAARDLRGGDDRRGRVICGSTPPIVTAAVPTRAGRAWRRWRSPGSSTTCSGR